MIARTFKAFSCAGIVCATLAISCVKSSDQAGPTTTPNDGGGTTADRGPTTVTLDGDPNGLVWDDAAQTLYIADDDNNRILKYTDADGISNVADLPAESGSQGPGLGQLAMAADGSFLVTRFGYGVNGDIAIAKLDGTSSVIPKLDPTKRRIGIAVAPDGTIFDSYFTKGSSADLGAVAKVTLDGTETEVVTGLQKPVGLTVIGASLYASDQDLGELLVAPYASPSTATVFAQLPDADIVCAGPDGSIFSGGSDGNVRQISAQGETTVFAGGFQAARGVAYDPTNKRLFVADHGSNNVIQIRPVD